MKPSLADKLASKDMELQRSEHCGGFKNCHESVREYNEADPECQECIEDVAEAHEQMEQYFKELNEFNKENYNG